MKVYHIHPSKIGVYLLGMLGLIVFLTACSSSNDATVAVKPTPKPIWTQYKGQAFTLRYNTSWGTATKDLYLGTNYPQLEMLNGIAFVQQGTPNTFFQVSYAESTNKTVSAQDIMSRFLLGSNKQPIKTSQFTTTTLDGVIWSQDTVKQQTAQGAEITKTALGLTQKLNNTTKIYIITYQDTSISYSINNSTFFQKMAQSFKFVA